MWHVYTHSPVVAITPAGLEREIVLNLLFQFGQVLIVQALQYALRIDYVQLVILDLLIQYRLLGGIDEAQCDGQPVDGLGASASYA